MISLRHRKRFIKLCRQLNDLIEEIKKEDCPEAVIFCQVSNLQLVRCSRFDVADYDKDVVESHIIATLDCGDP